MNLPVLQQTNAEIRILFMTVMKISLRSVEQFLASRNIELNRVQFGILHVLSERPFTLSELSKLFVLDPSSLVPVIDALENRGLVERERDPNDRRRVPLRLTEAGTALLQSVAGLHEDDAFVKSLTEMGEEKTQNLLNLLRELVVRMPDGDNTLRDIHEQLSLPESHRCPQRIIDRNV
jgi:DNA-binding MarR family transcriptional regulator